MKACKFLSKNIEFFIKDNQRVSTFFDMYSGL